MAKKMHCVVVPFMDREQAESYLCEVDERGFRGAVLPYGGQLERDYIKSADSQNRAEWEGRPDLPHDADCAYRHKGECTCAKDYRLDEDVELYGVEAKQIAKDRMAQDRIE